MEIGLKDADDRKGKIPRHKQASSKDDLLETPDDMYYGLGEKYDIQCELDPFTTLYKDGKSNTKCIYFFTYAENALNLEYLIPDGLKEDKKPTGVWINHPHSLHKQVLEHNEKQWLKHDLDMIMIIPANTCRPPFWYQYLQRHLNKGLIIEPYVDPKHPEKGGYINFKKRGYDTEFDSRNGYLVIRYFSKEKWMQYLKRKYPEWKQWGE